MRQKFAFTCSQILEQADLPMLERARKLSRLERAVLQCLPAELGGHCKVLNLKNEILVLATPSSAWAARLRFAVPDLLKQLKCQFSLNVARAELKIQPNKVEIQSAKQPRMQLSMDNAILLAQTAQSIRHPALQEALYRLAAKAREV
jgi:hypothetical protein